MVSKDDRRSYYGFDKTLHFILLTVNIINVIFHSFGGYLLCHVYTDSRTNDHRVQQILVINLAVTECLTNLLEILRIIPDLTILSESEFQEWVIILDSILIVSFSGFYLVLFATMFAITIDRLLDIFLNIKYGIYVTEKRIKRLLVTVWVIATMACTAELVYYHHHRFNWEDVFFIYFYPPVQFAFLILAVVTYGCIFNRYRQSRQPPITLPNQQQRRRQSAVQVFRRSRFYVSVLLILTFIVFMIIPDLTYVFLAKLENNRSDVLITSCLICYACSNLSDAFIYVFVQRRVRRALRQKLPWIMSIRSVEPDNEFRRSRASTNRHSVASDFRERTVTATSSSIREIPTSDNIKRQDVNHNNLEDDNVLYVSEVPIVALKNYDDVINGADECLRMNDVTDGREKVSVKRSITFNEVDMPRECLG